MLSAVVRRAPMLKSGHMMRVPGMSPDYPLFLFQNFAPHPEPGQEVPAVVPPRAHVIASQELLESQDIQDLLSASEVHSQEGYSLRRVLQDCRDSYQDIQSSEESEDFEFAALVLPKLSVDPMHEDHPASLTEAKKQQLFSLKRMAKQGNCEIVSVNTQGIPTLHTILKLQEIGELVRIVDSLAKGWKQMSEGEGAAPIPSQAPWGEESQDARIQRALKRSPVASLVGGAEGDGWRLVVVDDAGHLLSYRYHPANELQFDPNLVPTNSELQQVLWSIKTAGFQEALQKALFEAESDPCGQEYIRALGVDVVDVDATVVHVPDEPLAALLKMALCRKIGNEDPPETIVAPFCETGFQKFVLEVAIKRALTVVGKEYGGTSEGATLMRVGATDVETTPEDGFTLKVQLVGFK
mmetsp:Transcript_22624/g.41671  ORF Transcript_22624/g.41671 Transcript_22624/m.41671 type:complete len:410 (+) Transcript_22624:117-1346(+)